MEIEEKVSAPIDKAQKIYDNEMNVVKVDEGILIKSAKYVA
jgi:hypothetical protein